MRTQYIAGDWTVAEKYGDRRRIVPIPQIEDVYEAFEQDYTIARASFDTEPLNTASPDDATAFLQIESSGQDLGNEMMRWTRGYYPIPPAWDDWGTFAPTFPGFPGYIILPNAGAAANQGRNAFSNNVDCRIAYEYHMVGPGQTYANAGLIPLNPVQTYYPTANPTFYAPSVVPAAGVGFGSQYFLPTTPTQEDYQAWMANAAAHEWESGTATTPGPNGQGQIVVQCNRERLIGNLWALVTRYVLAQ